MKALLKLVTATAVAGLAAAGASATVVVTNSTQYDAAFTVSNTDLLQTNLAAVGSTGSFSREGEIGLSALIDGSFGAVGSVNQGNIELGAATADGSNSITYTLDGSFNLTSIETFAGWDAFRGGQSYTVSYAKASDPLTFITLASVYNNAFEGGNVNTKASIIRTGKFLATGVSAVKFDFNSDLQFGYAGYREIDVAGSTVPEPTSWALLLAGFGMVGVSMRRRSRAVVA